MKLTSLKLSKAESKSENKICGPASTDGPRYPYGTSIRLDKEALAKLDLKPTGFKVGDKLDLQAVVSVKMLRQVEGGSYDQNEVELQIESLGFEKRTKSALSAVEQGIKDAE